MSHALFILLSAISYTEALPIRNMFKFGETRFVRTYNMKNDIKVNFRYVPKTQWEEAQKTRREISEKKRKTKSQINMIKRNEPLNNKIKTVEEPITLPRAQPKQTNTDMLRYVDRKYKPKD